MIEPEIQKPRHGQPCNSCGKCCANEPCPLGREIFGVSTGRCPGLVVLDGKFGCDLVLRPEIHANLLARRVGADALSEAASILIGVGVGCDAQLNGETRDPTLRQRMILYREIHWRKILDARRKWGFP
jgi:hypothetical protein